MESRETALINLSADRSRDSDIENGHMDTAGGRTGWDELGEQERHTYIPTCKIES